VKQLLFALLLCAASAHAQQKEEITVTAEVPVEAASAGTITAQEIEELPIHRTGDVLEMVLGIVVSQHSGEGKANQYYLAGFDLDHGTDLAIDVNGVPVKLPSHAHGQGYADLNRPIASVDGGQFGYRRTLVAGSDHVAGGDLLAAFEVGASTGPWRYPDDLRKVNALLRFTRGTFGITAMAYDSRWNSTDQIPQRAAMPRFGAAA